MVQVWRAEAGVLEHAMADFKNELGFMSADEPRASTVSEEQHWRRDFAKIGPESLRLLLATSKMALPADYVHCANEWIADKEAEKSAIETSRYRKVLGWTIVGAIAAIIAAVASTIALFR
jgi:ABC-type Fe2+-enterobactin transport system substrate-binding protein